MKILGILSIILIVCSLICGLWMKFKPVEGDVNFHSKLSIGTLVMCMVTIIIYMVKI